MRIRTIIINRWRHFENIKLALDGDTGLVCRVGANGTGKSHLLELIAACAHRLGLSQGIEIPRGDPFSDPRDFSLQFFLAEGVSEAVDQGLAGEAAFAEWDRTLTIESRNLPGNNLERIEAGGIADAHQRIQFATQVINQLRQPAPRLIKEIRRARQVSATEPTFTDHFNGYKEALQKVIPHVVFTGVDSKKRTLLFDTTGMELTFDQLSGGEREIGFLIGQIDRFGLRQGLFLLDEPELHLNADLIRMWVAYLTGTVQTGQIWLATHSLEAVEAAGQQATFVLETNEETRKVDSLERLDTRPVLSALSRAVGTPAFSISKLLFIFVEGEEGVGERERFRKLAGLLQNVRFMECGSCNEVLRRVAAIKALANEAEGGIRIGGVVDRDFRTDANASAITNDKGVFVLPGHQA